MEEDEPGKRCGDDHQAAGHIFGCFGGRSACREGGDQEADQRQEDDSLDDVSIALSALHHGDVFDGDRAAVAEKTTRIASPMAFGRRNGQDEHANTGR